MADLTGKQKAAVVLLAVDSQTAASVLKKLSDDELTAVTREMNSLGELQADDAAMVLTEFSVHAGDDTGIQATPTALRERLELAVGRDGTREIFRDIGLDDAAAKVFDPLKELDPSDLHRILIDEHPQTAAVVMSNLEPQQASATLALFEQDLQTEIVRRMAGTAQTDEAILVKVGETIRGKTETRSERRVTPEESRYKKVADVINLLGKDAENRIMTSLAEDAPEMASRLKEMMLVFEDLVSVSDADMRKVLMAVDTQVLAMALKTASEELKKKISSNLSRRAQEMVNEEIEMLGPKPLSQVKGAQQQILESIRELEESGEINFSSVSVEDDPLV